MTRGLLHIIAAVAFTLGVLVTLFITFAPEHVDAHERAALLLGSLGVCYPAWLIGTVALAGIHAGGRS